MASELRVDTLKDSSGNNSVGMAYVAEGSAKAWVNYVGSSGSSNQSFNIASTTDVATGKTQPNYTNNFNADNYTVTCGGNRNGTTAGDSQAMAYFNALTGSVTFTTTTLGGTFSDFSSASGSAIGDLA